MKKTGVLQRKLPTRMAYLALFLVTLVAAQLMLSCATAHAAQAVMSWSTPTTYSDGSALTGVKGYKLYTGTARGSYSNNVDLGNANSYTMTGLSDATTYYFAVTAYDSTGNSSGYSNEVSYTTPAAGSGGTASAYTLTATAGSGGSITPSGATVVSSGANQAYTVTPAAGYYIASVTVDGTAVAANVAGGTAYSYSLSKVSAPHSISASFALRSYHIVASAGTGGSVSPGDTWTPYQGSQTISITPASGYQVTDVTVDGKSLGAVSSYTFANLSADHSVAATFATGYSITASAGANGSITPAGTTAVAGGSSKSYSITPSTGYYVKTVTVDGATVASDIPSGGYSYTFSNLSGSHTIAATFDVRYYNIATTAGTGGSITASSWVLYNTSPSVTITPASGKKIASVLVDGVSVGAVSSYTFSNVSAPHTISATFM